MSKADASVDESIQFLQSALNSTTNTPNPSTSRKLGKPPLPTSNSGLNGSSMSNPTSPALSGHVYTADALPSFRLDTAGGGSSSSGPNYPYDTSENSGRNGNAPISNWREGRSGAPVNQYRTYNYLDNNNRGTNSVSPSQNGTPRSVVPFDDRNSSIHYVDSRNASSFIPKLRTTKSNGIDSTNRTKVFPAAKRFDSYRDNSAGYPHGTHSASARNDSNYYSNPARSAISYATGATNISGAHGSSSSNRGFAADRVPVAVNTRREEEEEEFELVEDDDDDGFIDESEFNDEYESVSNSNKPNSNNGRDVKVPPLPLPSTSITRQVNRGNDHISQSHRKPLAPPASTLLNSTETKNNSSDIADGLHLEEDGRTHEENMETIVFYLKNYYAQNYDEERKKSIDTLTPEEITLLAQVFYIDVYRLIRRLNSNTRNKNLFLPDGEDPLSLPLDSSPNADKSNNANNNNNSSKNGLADSNYEYNSHSVSLLSTPRLNPTDTHSNKNNNNATSIITSNNAKPTNEGNSKNNISKKDVSSNSNNNNNNKNNSVKEEDKQHFSVVVPNGLSTAPKPPPSPPTPTAANNASKRNAAVEEVRSRISLAPPDQVSEPAPGGSDTSLSRRRSVEFSESADLLELGKQESSNTAFITANPRPGSFSFANRGAGTSNSGVLSQSNEVGGSGIVKRPLRELMPILRRGDLLLHYKRNNRPPKLLFFQIRDCLDRYKGKEVYMPHLVWGKYGGTAISTGGGLRDNSSEESAAQFFGLWKNRSKSLTNNSLSRIPEEPADPDGFEWDGKNSINLVRLQEVHCGYYNVNQHNSNNIKSPTSVRNDSIVGLRNSLGSDVDPRALSYFQKLFKVGGKSKGAFAGKVVDADGEPVPSRNIMLLLFSGDEALGLAARSESQRQAWAAAFMGIVERNRSLKTS